MVVCFYFIYENFYHSKKIPSMKHLYYFNYFIVTLLLSSLLPAAGENFVNAAVPPPDTQALPDGWRRATPEDIAYWPNVEEGDVLLFGKVAADGTRTIFTNYNMTQPIQIEGGKRIHIYQGTYRYIEIAARPDGKAFQEVNSSPTNPVIITNLGGQVKFGVHGPNADNDGNFWVHQFKHIMITGEYDQALGTGDANFLGMKGDMTAHGWINNFGIMGDRQFAMFPEDGTGLGLQVNHFISVKVRGIGVVRGYFAGISVKNNDVLQTSHASIEIQRCLSGWHSGEGFYIGSTNEFANTVSDNVTVFKNNIALFTGAEGVQLDKLNSGSEIKNNFVYKTACFYQNPFQKNQDNCFQWSFVNGNVIAEDNIFYGGTAANLVNYSGIYSKTDVTIVPSSQILLRNNLFGGSRTSWAYIKESTGDPNGYITYHYDNNVIKDVTTQVTNDYYVSPTPFTGYVKFHQDATKPFYLENNIYPVGRNLTEGGNIQSTQGSVAQEAEALLLDSRFGFNPDDILNFRGVWFTGTYVVDADATTSSGPIPYKLNDVVYAMAGGRTRYYKCIQAHSVVKDPVTQSAYWQQIFWNGQEEPTYTPLLQPGSSYASRNMGLNLGQDPPPSGTGRVTWTEKVGVSEDANGTLTKTAAYGTNNAGAASVEVLSAGTNGWVEMEINQIDKARVFGLADSNPDNSETSMDYALSFGNYTPFVHVRESGVYKGEFGTHAIGEVYKIERVGTTVYYKRNGQTFYTSSTASTTNLRVDVSLYHTGTQIYNCNISFADTDPSSLITWTDKVGVSEDGNANLTKTAAYGTNNAGAASVEVLSAGTNGWAEMEINQIDKARVFGLADSNPDNSETSMDYALSFGNYTPFVHVRESGVYKGEFGTHAIGEVYKIERVGTTVYYKRNGQTFYTSGTASTTNLRVDVSLYHTGTQIYNGRISFGNGGARLATTQPQEQIDYTDVYPNPIGSTSRLFLRTNKEDNGDYSLIFKDATGRTEWQGTMKGSSTIEVDIESLKLSPGIKILHIVAPDGTVKTRKLLKRD
jgi:hypothetical protein